MATLGIHQLPNLLTVLRIGLVPPLVLAMLEQQYRTAFILFSVAGMTDFIDGQLAKRFNWTSEFGAMVDPLADKLLMVTTVLILASQELLPWWVAAIILGRDIIIVSGAVAYRLWIGTYQFAPTLLGKTNTLFQILYLGMVLIYYSQWWQPPYLISILLALMVATTVMSGCQYVWEWSGRAYRAKQQPNTCSKISSKSLK